MVGEPNRRSHITCKSNSKMVLGHVVCVFVSVWGGLDISGLGNGPVDSFYEHGSEPSDCIKPLKFMYRPINCNRCRGIIMRHGACSFSGLFY